MKLKMIPLPLSPFQLLKPSNANTSTDSDRADGIIDGNHNTSDKANSNNNSANIIINTRDNNTRGSNTGGLADQLKNISIAGNYPPTVESTSNNSDGDDNVLEAFTKQQYQRQRLSSGEGMVPYDSSFFGMRTSADFGQMDPSRPDRSNQWDTSLDDSSADLEEDLPFVWTVDTVVDKGSDMFGRSSDGDSLVSRGNQGTRYSQCDSTAQYVSSNQSIDASHIISSMLRQRVRSFSSAVSEGIFNCMASMQSHSLTFYLCRLL